MTGRVVFLTEDPLDARASGGVLRRNGLVKGLRESGHDARVVVVERPTGLVRRRLAVRHHRLKHAGTLELFTARSEVDAVVVGGLPLAASAMACRELGIRCVIDMCDSWLSIASNRRSPTTRGAIELLMRRYVPAANAVTYISEQEKRHDASRFPKLPPSYVVSNGVPRKLLSLSPSTSPGAALFAADFSYVPNLMSLDWLIDEVWPYMSDRGPDIVLCGPVRPERRLPEGIAWAGFFPDLRQIYAEAAVVLAPIRGGAGIKNKVLEGVAAGRPVVATTDGTSGLDALGDVVYVADDPAAFAATVTALCADPRPAADRIANGREIVRPYTWAASVRILEAALALRD